MFFGRGQFALKCLEKLDGGKRHTVMCTLKVGEGIGGTVYDGRSPACQ